MPIPQSKRDQIVAAAVAALNAGADKPCTAYRSRVDAFAATELPAFVVFPVENDPERMGPNTTKHKFTLRVECLTKGEAPQDQALDPLLVYVVKTLYADAAFTALLKGLEEGPTRWDVEPAYDDVAIASLDLYVTHATAATDPSVAK